MCDFPLKYATFCVDFTLCQRYNSIRNHVLHMINLGGVMKTNLKSFFKLSVSIFIMAIGIYFFKFANNFSFGGITGLAVLVAKIAPISASDFSFIMNMLLLVIGYFVLGKSFAMATAYGTILLSALLSIFERVFPMTQPLTDQPILELCFAIALPAFASAMLFNMGASSGGTDIIAAIAKKYTSVNIGRALLYSDVIFAAASFLIFDIKTGLYSILGLFVRSLMIDNFIESFNLSKYFNVVCCNPTPICDFITHDLNRSATIVLAQGAFTGEDRYMVLTALNRSQAVKLRNHIKEVEPGAFILISNTSEIIGKGFHTV